MCNLHNNSSRNPINCIIPPHMLEVISMRGDKKIAGMARAMLSQNAKVREERAEMASGAVLSEKTRDITSFITPALAAAAPTRNLNREIYDGGNKASLPGKLARKEGDGPTGDQFTDEAYDGAGDVYDLYFDCFDRDSLDGAGNKLVQTVHHRRNYANAFWDGSQMVYGDGDGEIFQKFTELSVIGHEMSHGVVQFSGGLVYQGQSGALNESYADVFGVLTVQKKLGQAAHEADWLVGRGILAPGINGVALRSMKAPGTAYADTVLGQDPQPYHMDLYVDTTADNGGVHINSGIPNHAFHLFAQYLGGSAWEAPGKIWYDALQRINNPHATFIQWAIKTIESATTLCGTGSVEVQMLRRAWKLVGISV